MKFLWYYSLPEKITTPQKKKFLPPLSFQYTPYFYVDTYKTHLTLTFLNIFMFPLLDAPQRLQQFPELSLMPRQVLNKSFGKTRDKNSQFIQ